MLMINDLLNDFAATYYILGIGGMFFLSVESLEDYVHFLLDLFVLNMYIYLRIYIYICIFMNMFNKYVYSGDS